MKFPAILGVYDRPPDRPNDQLTERADRVIGKFHFQSGKRRKKRRKEHKIERTKKVKDENKQLSLKIINLVS